MLKILTLPFKILKWFFMLLLTALGLFLVGILIYITNIMRNPDTMTSLAGPLGQFFNAANIAMGGNIQWMKDWSSAMGDTTQIAQIASTANTVFGVTIAVVCVGGLVVVAGVVLKILNKARKAVT